MHRSRRKYTHRASLQPIITPRVMASIEPFVVQRRRRFAHRLLCLARRLPHSCDSSQVYRAKRQPGGTRRCCCEVLWSYAGRRNVCASSPDAFGSSLTIASLVTRLSRGAWRRTKGQTNRHSQAVRQTDRQTDRQPTVSTVARGVVAFVVEH